MRVAALACLPALALAVAALGAACSEQFPSATAPGAEGGADVTDGGSGTGSDDGGPLEGTPPAPVPANRRVNASSSPVVFDALRGGVWTANGDVGTVSYVDPDKRALVQELPAGQDLRSVALSPDGAWLAAVDRAGGAVVLVDAERRVVRRTLPVGSHPRAGVWDAADPRWLYVAVEDDGVVAVVDRTAGQVAARVPVGRLPAGLAVSATKNELYVTHRVDADVTVVDLGARVAAAHVALADEPFSALLTPNGKPFAFEGLAVTSDGLRAWVPHELLAPTHPFVFNETLFPAVSVVDLAKRIEVQTNRNSANVDGRKNLFDAIKLLGPDGQPQVFSQPCGIAMHRNGFTAWVLACASEDLLTFDVNQGTAVDVVRNAFGDHPAGLTLDDTGQRVFVLADQSHQLTTLDTDGGSLVGHTRVYGDPIAVVGKDPVDPTLRAGLTLFFRANPSKGALTTTNDDWMSCGGCHLDGFGSTNARLFESLVPHDPALDAQIGHVGLKDLFSTTAPGGASLQPHDVLVALADQGGLVPPGDAGPPVSPDAPTQAATTMAQQLAAVIARDLPAQPTWARQAGSAPNLAWDTAFCGSESCHPTEYAAWKTSVHAHAGEDPMMRFCDDREQQLVGKPFGRLCVGCHDPVGARTGDFTLGANRGVTCIGCHDVELPLAAGGNGDLAAAPHDWSTDHKAWALASLEKLRQPTFCAGCHEQFVPGSGLVGIGTVSEYEGSPYAGKTLCVDCHMPKSAGVADHRAAGGNVYMGQTFGDSTLVEEQTAHLKNVLSVDAQRVEGGVLVKLTNVGAGHGFPTGVTDIRQPWVQIEATPANGGAGSTTIYGGPGADGVVPQDAARLGIDIAQADGTLLLQHELSRTTRIPFDVRVPPGGAQVLFVPVPPQPPGTTLQAVVTFGVVRATYYRAAVGNTDAGAGATPPTIEIARATVR